MAESVEQQLARFATATVLDDDARAMMRLSLYDWTVCALAGQREAVAEILIRKGEMEGGAPQATVIGGVRLPAPRAALINGAISHALDYDDTHFDHIGHTSVAVIPAALTMAQAQGRTMAEFIDAALIGSEAAIRIGTWLGRAHYQVGFHQTATSGAFGAALAGLRLIETTRPKIIAGLGLAASRASGLKCQFGTMGKPLNAGLAAEAGVEAALWAQAGLSAAERGVSGPLGFAATYHGENIGSAFDGMGADWRMKAVSHKFHACCHGLHAMLEALGSLNLTADEVASVKIATHPRWMSVCNNPAPRTGLEAKFSYKQAASMALMGIATGRVAAFDDAVALHPSVSAVAEKVTVVTDDSLTEMQARVTVTLKDGRVKDAFHDLSTTLPHDVLARKLRDKGRMLIGDAAEQVWDAVQGNSLRSYVDVLSETPSTGWEDGVDLIMEVLDYFDV
ncbi:MmgE/PrpD family protein [Yoonia sp. 2307UL14-13]|uniref:MmgE/PrpD family protein n=1 Tax=Yoonia sp. 2307UL14-13 TaxID=3126506 RepID=UPI0030B748D2